MPGSVWLQDVSRGDVPYVVANLVVVGKPREAMRKEEERKGAEMNRNKQQTLLVKMAVFIAMTCMSELEVFIMFVGRSSYKDEPKVDTDGKPSSRRTTPLHHVVKQDCNVMTHMIRLLFEIYNQYDVNYTDESGLSHFHVACRCGHVAQLAQSPITNSLVNHLRLAPD
ncbi:hypothetical protein TKK_0002308 [Trichogramma kaykai]